MFELKIVIYDCFVFFDSPVNSEDMVQDLIEKYQRHVQLFLIENLQTRLHVVSQLLLLHWDVVLHPKKNQYKLLWNCSFSEDSSHSFRSERTSLQVTFESQLL